MLRELILSWRTRTEPALRRLGYRYAAVALATRAQRCAKAWAPHQARTRDAILAAADAVGQGRAVLVLGSGPCADIPVKALAARFGRVILADAAHPPRAAALARRHPNVALATLDLTGMAEGLLDTEAEAPPHPGSIAFLDDHGIDLVISANLLSQLPLIPLGMAARRWPGTDLEALGRAIVEAHLTHLAAFRCPVLLLADVDRRTLGRDGRILSHEDPLFRVPLPPGEEWDWPVAPAGELPRGRSVLTRVRAVRLR